MLRRARYETIMSSIFISINHRPHYRHLRNKPLAPPLVNPVCKFSEARCTPDLTTPSRCPRRLKLVVVSSGHAPLGGDHCRADDVVGKKALERVEQDLEKMSRERLLPDEKTLEKVGRYEAHLSRLFHKALHELEALQVRRLGGSAPLARLDVEGLARS